MPRDNSAKELTESFKWLVSKWNAQVKKIAGESYRGGVYWTWDSLGIVNVEFAVWKGDEPIASFYQTFGPLSEIYEEEFELFFKEHPEEASLTSSYKYRGILERELWSREAEDIGGDFIYYSEVEKVIKDAGNGKVAQEHEPHYGRSSSYSAFDEFNTNTQGPYFGGG